MNTDSKLSQQLKNEVERALDTIRPFLEADGGNVKYIGVTKEMKVILELLGNCSSCKMSSMTLKAGVEEAIIKAMPQITGVEAINTLSVNA